MFNTLLYIPSILAYTFLALLLVILGFIVIYVSHKIYTILYDYLPVAQLSAKSSLAQETESMTKPSDKLTLRNKRDGQVDRKSKTALRIIVSMEPCYLAYMLFEPKLHASPTPSSRLDQINRNLARSSSNSSALRDSVGSQYFLIKYFENLASIPRGRDLQICDNFNNLGASQKSK